MRRLVYVLVAGAMVLARGAVGEEAKKEAQVKDWDPIPAKSPSPDRFKNYHEAVARGPHAKVVAATFFGTKDYEEFVGGGELPDETLVVMGNAWGPSFPEAPKPVVLGKGTHSGAKSTTVAGRDRKEALDMQSPDRSGFIVFYKPGLSGVAKVVKFDWGVFAVSAGAVAADGKGLLLAGRAQAAFDTLKDVGGVSRGTGSVCVVRLNADGETIEWVRRMNGNPPDKLWQDKAGNVYVAVTGLQKITRDGKETLQVSERAETGTSKWLLVDLDGNAYCGGDRNTKTGREPWRQPYFYKYSPDGKKLWSCWEFNPRDVSSAHGGLESDSSVRGAVERSDGTLVVTGWSDGGNSVFQRMATDWKKNCPDAPLGWSPWWPKGANSYAHVMIFDPLKQETQAHLWWCGYLPMNFQGGANYGNRTAFQSIHWVTVAKADAIGFTGTSGSGLIQTPNAFWKDQEGRKYGAESCVILNNNLSGILFSSYLPGISDAKPVPTRKGLLVVGRSAGDDGAAPSRTPSPAINALQPFAGATDAHAFYLELP